MAWLSWAVGKKRQTNSGKLRRFVLGDGGEKEEEEEGEE